MTDPVLLVELTTWLAESVAIDEELFAIVGRWSVDEADPVARISYSTVSRWLGEHSIAASKLLADSPALGAEQQVVVSNEWAADLAELSGVADRQAKLRAVLLARNERDASISHRLSEVADSAVLRHLSHTGIDLKKSIEMIRSH